MASDLPTADDLRKTSQHGIALAPRTYASPQRDRLIHEWAGLEAAIISGKSIRATLDAMGVDYQAFYDLIEESPAHGERYSRARAARADRWHERAETATDKLLSADKDLDANAINAMRAGLSRIDWLTKVLDPKKYGDNKHMTVDVMHKSPLDELTDEQLHALARRRGAIDTTATRVADGTIGAVKADDEPEKPNDSNGGESCS